VFHEGRDAGDDVVALGPGEEHMPRAREAYGLFVARPNAPVDLVDAGEGDLLVMRRLNQQRGRRDARQRGAHVAQQHVELVYGPDRDFDTPPQRRDLVGLGGVDL